MKKSLSIIMFLLCISSIIYGQNEISRCVLSSSGGTINNDQGYKLDWTFGSQFTNISMEEYHLTEGFQQGVLSIKEDRNFAKEIERVTIGKTFNSIITFHAYPNPTTDQLYIIYKNDEADHASLTIMDQSGKTLLAQDVFLEPNINLEVKGVEQLHPGQYFIQIVPIKNPRQTLAFLKI